MDPEIFKQELAKYKVVRNEDFYRPRMRKVEAKTSKPASRPVTSSTTAISSEKVNRAITASILDDSSNFWTQMEQACKELMTDKEVREFMQALHKNYVDVPGMINLEDLNAAASLVSEAK